MDDLVNLNNQLLSGIGVSDEEHQKKLEVEIAKILNLDRRKFPNNQILEVKIKFKKLPKYFNEIFPGQIFEIYLSSIGQYSYGVILSGDYSEDKNADIIIGYLPRFISEPMPFGQIIDLIKKKKFAFIANTGIYSIKTYDWKHVGTFTNEILKKEEIEKIAYKTKFMGKFYKSVGISSKAILDCEVISEKEYRTINNPLGIIGDEAIENMLIEFYKNNLKE